MGNALEEQYKAIEKGFKGDIEEEHEKRAKKRSKEDEDEEGDEDNEIQVRETETCDIG